MRVLHVVQELGVGGAERVVVSLVAAARRTGDEAAVVAAPGPLASELQCPTYPLPMVRRRPERLVAAAVAIARAMRSFRPDVVHCHNPTMALAAAAPTHRGRRVRALVSVHGVPDTDYPAAARAIRRSGIPAVACGPGVARALGDNGVVVRATVVNGISPPPPPLIDRRPLLKEWGLPEDAPLLLSVGRLVPQKNHGVAIRAVALLPDACLAVLGAGPLRGDLLRLAVTEGVAARVAVPGPQPDARAIMAAADVILLPSKWEGLPLVGLEALASRTPLVAGDAAGIRELFVHGVHCLLVDPDDPRALAGAIRQVTESEHLRVRLVEAGARLVESYTEEAMAKRFRSLYVGGVGARS